MDPLSKTQKKKDALALQELGKRLVLLSSHQIKSIDLPAPLYQAITLAKTLKKHGALDRQMQHIGALMRRYDPQPIQDALRKIERGNRPSEGQQQAAAPADDKNPKF
jgi:ribosome-associated protein